MHKIQMAIIMALILIIGIIVFVESEENSDKPTDNKTNDKISVEILSAMNQPSIVLMFSIKNNSKNVIWATPLGVNNNRIIVTNPKGEMVEICVNKDYPTEVIETFIIKPTETKRWEFNIIKFIDSFYLKEFFEDVGVYKLYWHVNICVNWEKKTEQSSYTDYLTRPISFIKEQKTEGIVKKPWYEKTIKETTEQLSKIIKKEKNDKPVSVDIVYVLDKPSALLEFMLTNNGKEDIETTPICTNDNKIVIVTPDGIEKECAVVKNDKEKEKVIIKPSETKSWRVDIKEIAKTYEISLEKPGTYKVYWKMVLVNKDGEKDKKQEFISSPVFFYQPDKDDKPGSDNPEKPKEK